MVSEPTFDYFPRGTPLLVTDRIEEAMHSVLDAGGSAGAAYDAMEEAQVRQLEEDPEFRAELRQAYADAGVDLVSATMGSLDQNLSFPEGVRRDIARWQARFDSVDWLEKVTSPAEAREVVDRGNVGVVLNVQNGGAAIDGDVDETSRLYNSGVRVVQLTYNSQNLVGVGCTERVDAGLSEHGVEFVDRLDERDVIVDVSHCGTETTFDAIEVSNNPVAVTHAFCRDLSAHDRGKTDEELAAVADANGYVGIVAVPFFLDANGSDPEFDVLFDHIDHAVSIVGVDRVGIGTDWGSWTPELPEPLHDGIMESFKSMGFREEHGVRIGEGFGPMQHFRDWTAIPDGLAERGYSDAEIAKITGGNFVDYWERVTS